MRIYYSISRGSPQTRRNFIAALWLVGAAALVPLFVAQSQCYFGYDTSGFNDWLHPMNSEQHLSSGLYCIVWGVGLYLFGMVVGDEAVQMRDYDRTSYDHATHRYGAVSQIMLLCQTGAVLITMWGLMKLAIVVSNLF